MPQLVNQLCVVCRQRIESDLEAVFCPLCGNPVHCDCKNPANLGADQCSACGGDINDSAAVQERLRRLDDAAIEEARQDKLQARKAGSQQKRGNPDVLTGSLLVGGCLLLTLGALVMGSSVSAIACGPIVYGLILIARGVKNPPRVE
jgi:hypothetical protein